MARKILLPDLDTCDQLLESVETSTSADEQARFIEQLVAAHQTVSMSLGRGSVFWRARRCGPGGFNEESSLSYPPAPLAKPGRLNNNGESVLYLSTRRETALAEVGAVAGDLIHLGGFRVKRDSSVRVASVGEWHVVHKLGKMRFGPPEGARAITRIMNKAGFEVGRSLIYVDAILGDILASQSAHDTEYLSTRLLINALYKKLPEIDGIAYPSVKDVGLNLAIRAQAADRAIEGCASLMLEVQKVRRHGIYDYRTVKAARGVATDGSFDWAPSCQPNEMIIYRFHPGEDASSIPFAHAIDA